MHRTARVLAAALALVACGSSERAGGPGAAPSPRVPSEVPAPAPAEVDGGCPPRYSVDPGAPWVPAAPTTETAGRLVPDADPVEALVCRYERRGDGPAPLVGASTLRGGLDRIRTELHRAEQAPEQDGSCPGAGGPQVPHLLRLRYADGELWLSAVRGPACAVTTNGAFRSSADLGERLGQAYDTGTWITSAGSMSAGSMSAGSMSAGSTGAGSLSAGRR